MKVANNNILVYSDNEFLSKLLKEEFTQIKIERCATTDYLPQNIVVSCAVIIIDKQGVIQVNDEVIAKPFAIAQLIKVINNLLAQNRSSSCKIGDYEFFPALNIVIRNEEVISLTDKESELLAYLIRVGDFVHKNELLQQIWGYKNEIETKTLETHIYKLKQKLPIIREILIKQDSGYKIFLPEL